MASPHYLINYLEHPTVSFPTEGGMRAYISKEQEIWEPFLSELPNLLPRPIHFQNHTQQTLENLSLVFQTLEGRLGNVNEFNKLTIKARNGAGVAVPPNSDSEEGIVLLALFTAGKAADAAAVYLSFIEKNFKANLASHQDLNQYGLRGTRLLEAASVVTVLPFSKVSSAKLAGAARKAENYNAALEQEVANAVTINEAHEGRLDEFLNEQEQRSARVDRTILDLNKRRTRQYHEWKSGIDAQVSERFEQAETRIAAMQRANTAKQRKHEEEFERLQDLFATQLRLRAPVTLWEGREATHNKKSNSALLRLLVFGTVTAGIAVAVPVCFGDYIAGSFFEIVCSPQGAEGAASLQCERLFSAKGPLTVTGLLLAMSILTWITRLQYRIHLSERHLALDASEKKAFAETYLAMKEGEDVGQDNEAIVLASLFRPTQDGIIRDDETGMDLSAVALLAKQLGKN